jgi:CheY-like chemotaxis protein
VYVYVPGQQKPVGPYVIVEVLSKEQYRLQEKASGREHHKLVPGLHLLVKE